MADGWQGTAGSGRGMAVLAEAILNAQPFDTIDLDTMVFGDWRIGLADGQWLLSGAAGMVQFGGFCGARMRLRRHGFIHLLVGGNGHPSIRAALDVAGGGEIVLVAPGCYDEGAGFIIDSSVTLQGVMPGGIAVTDCDTVAASIVSRAAEPGGPAMVVAAPGVIIHGLALTCAAAPAGAAAPEQCGRLLEIRASGFSLLSSVVGAGAQGQIASAIHCAGAGGADVRQHAFLSGNLVHGSITLALAGPMPRAAVAILGNRIEADLLPPVCVSCEARMLVGADAAAVLPVIEDNRMRTSPGQHVSVALQWEAGADVFSHCSDAVDQYFSRLINANPGIGAVVVDAGGHIRATPLPDFTGTGRSGPGLAVYDSVQAAQPQAGDTDMIHIGDEQLRYGQDRDASMQDDLRGVDVLCVLHSGLDAVVRVRLFSATGRLKRVCDGIQRAIEAAEDGDRIVVPAGRHVGDLYLNRQVAMVGANCGRPASSPRRGIETTVLGKITIGRFAPEVVIDGLAVLGSVEIEGAAAAGQRFVLRNCVIDGRDGTTAITVQGGAGSALANNLVLGGSEEAIRIPRGFDDLAISGNRIHAATGSVGIALSGGPGIDSLQILGNTFIGGDYGILLEVDEGLTQPGDAVTIAGNHFGEVLAGVVAAAPVVAAIHADGPVPAALEQSLGASLEHNTYHVAVPGVGADVPFETPRRSAGGHP